MSAFGMLLGFDTEDALFARGFEAGRIWGVLRERPEDEFEEYVSARNAEMVLRIAEATGRAVKSEEIGDEWLLVTFQPAAVVPESA